MDRHRREVAAALLAASREHDAEEEDRVERFRNVEPESAELLGVLVRATNPETVLEVGTSISGTMPCAWIERPFGV